VTGLWIVAALYVLFIGLCVGGYAGWRRVERTSAPGEVAAARV